MNEKSNNYLAKVLGIEGMDEKAREKLLESLSQAIFQEIILRAGTELKEDDVKFLEKMLKEDATIEEVYIFLRTRLPNADEIFESAAMEILQKIKSSEV